uniref:Uncharacterized protein n=1 Tax=Triticum urartu TaxID=4572 RepID=A0A8R7PD96_TRIUA
MEYRRVKDQESYDAISQKDIESPDGRSLSSTAATSPLGTAGGSKGKNSWKQKSIVTIALTLLTSSQAILIVWSKRAGKYEYSVTTANFSPCTEHGTVKVLQKIIGDHSTIIYRLSYESLFPFPYSLPTFLFIFRLSTSFDEVSVYPIPAALYMVKN